MGERSDNLRQARKRCGWSQEQAIVRFESIAHALDVDVPARGSLRTLFSMFENNRRSVPDHYRPVLRELYRATDEELGISQVASVSLPVPPALPADLPEKASPEILSYLSNVLAEHVKADAVVGPRYLVQAVQSQLPLIDRLCQATRGTDRSEVLAVAAQFAEFCGWLYQDSGKPDSAVFWTNHALDYAQELNDPQLIAYIMSRKSNIATESGKPGYGLGLANAALNAFDALTPRIRAASLRQRANAHALLSEQQEFEETVDQALIQASAGTAQETPDVAMYCTPPYVVMEAGMSWVRLGQPGSAVEAFERSLATWPSGGQTRDRGLCLARLATAAAVQGNTQRSCDTAAEALTIARSTGSARIRRQLHSLYHELSPHGSDPLVRDLRAQLVPVA
jgi:hypothetical protein